MLGRLFFNIYVNDLDFLLNNVSIVKYADDTTLSHSSDDIQHLQIHMQDCLNKLSTWCTFNKLALNNTITKFVIFTNRGMNYLPQLYIGQAQIECVTEFRYLGIIVDSKLIYQKHYENLILKLSRFCGFAYRLGYFFDAATARLFYFSCIYSTPTYGIVIWGGLLNFVREARLQSLQNKIIKN